MNLVKYITLALSIVLCLSACSDDDSNDNVTSLPIEKGEEAQRMLFMYIVADNNLEYFSQDDLNEVLEAADEVPDDCYLLAFVDDTNDPRVLRYFNNNGVGDYETVYNFGREFAACDTADMRVLFDWVGENYPAKKMDLVFWSHATGWLHDDSRRAVQQFSFGYDTAAGKGSDYSRMYIEELAGLLKSLEVKPDRIMFDACFMQCAEVAYALRNSANWIIASPAEIPGPGAPYDALVPLFFNDAATPQDIINAYKQAYEGTSTGVVLSAVRCDAMQHFADATAVAVKEVLSTVSGGECSDVFSYLPGGAFGWGYAFPNFFDMNSVMLKYLSSEDYAAWKEVLDMALPYRCASEGWYTDVLGRYLDVEDTWSGISMYLPNVGDSRFNDFNNSFTLLEWYNAAAWNE